jgi:hypothetical protein
MGYRFGNWYIDMVIYHIDMVILDVDMGDEANDMGDDSIHAVISHIDMGYLVTLPVVRSPSSPWFYGMVLHVFSYSTNLHMYYDKVPKAINFRAPAQKNQS